MKKYIATEVWKIVYPDPIILKKDDRVALTNDKTEEDPEWKGWTWCATADNAGWVPVQILQKINNDEALVVEDYTARELAVNIGEIVFALHELNGWLWCTKESTEESGWLPENILKGIDNSTTTYTETYANNESDS